MGVDLFALALLMATLRDWLVICQRRVPVVYGLLVLANVVRERRGRYLKTWCEHPRCDYEVGNDKA